MIRLLVILALLITSVATAAAGGELPTVANQRLQAGLGHFRAQRYGEAIAEFRAGYRSAPRPEFLFAIAQAERLRGDCEAAVELYQQFLASEPPQAQRQAAEQGLERCAPAAAEPPMAAPVSMRVTSRVEPEASAAPSSGDTLIRTGVARRWYHDRTAHVLTGAATISLVLGASAYAASSDAVESARAASDDAVADAQLDRAVRQRTVGAVALTAGVALLGGAIYRYVTAEDESSAGSGIELGIDDRGVRVGLAGHF